MAKARTLSSQVRNGALLAGIPLLLTGFVPYTLEPKVVFSWQVARSTDHVAPLVAPAAGLMILAVGLVPGLPRFLRALLMMVFAGAAGWFIYDLVANTSALPTDSLGDVESILTEPRTLFLVGSLFAAGIFELWMQARKVSKALAFLAFLGWGAFSSNLFLPVADEMPIVTLIESIDVIGQAGAGAAVAFSVFCMFFLLVFLSLIFAVMRLFGSAHNMLGGLWRTGAMGVVTVGAPGWIILIAGVTALVESDNLEGLLAVANISAIGWGLSVGLLAGIVHTVMGFAPDVIRLQPQRSGQAHRGFSPHEVTHPAAHQAGARVPSSHRPFNYDGQPQAQPQQAAPAAAPQLEPYPGYPGYFVCPNGACRGGVAANTPSCPHCGSQVSWG